MSNLGLNNNIIDGHGCGTWRMSMNSLFIQFSRNNGLELKEFIDFLYSILSFGFICLFDLIKQ